MKLDGGVAPPVLCRDANDEGKIIKLGWSPRVESGGGLRADCAMQKASRVNVRSYAAQVAVARSHGTCGGAGRLRADGALVSRGASE